jgi:hypothetical protein
VGCSNEVHLVIVLGKVVETITNSHHEFEAVIPLMKNLQDAPCKVLPRLLL